MSVLTRRFFQCKLYQTMTPMPSTSRVTIHWFALRTRRFCKRLLLDRNLRSSSRNRLRLTHYELPGHDEYTNVKSIVKSVRK